MVAEAAWRTGGVAAEIAAAAAGEVFERLRAPVVRVTLPDAPAPMSRPLERAYFPGAADIVAGVERALGRPQERA